jgi:hypothetical protein
MNNLVLLAAAIPFAIVVVVFTVLVTVRYDITDKELRVSILGFAMKRVPLNCIAAVEFVPALEKRTLGLFQHDGTVVVHAEGGVSVYISPKGAQSFSQDLKNRVFTLTGRRV